MRISDSLHGWRDYSKRVLYSRPKTKPFHGLVVSFHLDRKGSSGRNTFNADVPVDGTMIAYDHCLGFVARSSLSKNNCEQSPILCNPFRPFHSSEKWS